MKRCPECNSSFPDTDKFCELDGTTLVADYSDSDPDLLVPPAAGVVDVGRYQHSTETRLRQNWKTLTIVAVAGVAMGIVLFTVYQGITREAQEQSSNESSNEAVTQQQMPVLPSLPSPFASPSPSAEPSASPSAMPTPTAQAESARVTLSSSPVSTGGSDTTRRGPVTIRMTDGTSVEADEVWETGEGIWYRRRGLVTLLERSRVKAIDKAPTASPSPAATTTPASPSPSP
jgi:type IV secretory pathway VirB10-like protein